MRFDAKAVRRWTPAKRGALRGLVGYLCVSLATLGPGLPAFAQFEAELLDAVLSDAPFDAGLDLNVDGAVDSADLVTDEAARNEPPAFDPIAPASVELGDEVAVSLSASDPDGDVVSFMPAAPPLPEGARLDGGAGVLTFRPVASQVGTVEIPLTAMDGRGGAATRTATIEVRPASVQGTSLRGRILDANAAAAGETTPIVGATILLEGFAARATTDADGFFDLTGVAGGLQVIVVDCTTADAAPDGSDYANFREGLNLTNDVANVVPRPFYMPRIAAESVTPIDPAAFVTVTNPTLATSAEIPPNTARDEQGELFEGELSISEVPGGFEPVALPEGLEPSMLLTMQPVGVRFDTPIRVTFPNLDNLPSGSQLDLWAVNPDTGTFDRVGVGTASGNVILTSVGGLSVASWFAFISFEPTTDGSDNNNENHNCNCPPIQSRRTGSETAVASGNLNVVHDVPAYRSLEIDRSPKLVYNSQFANPQPILSARTNFAPNTAIPNLIRARLSVAGVDQGHEIFTDPSALMLGQMDFVRQSFHFDASRLPTGAYDYRFAIASVFANSVSSSFVEGRALVNNLSDSPFGAGWSLAGLDRLVDAGNGDKILQQGDGAVLLFADSPLGDGYFGRGFEFAVGSGPRSIAAGDFNDDGFDDFVAPGQNSTTLSVYLSDGQGGFAPLAPAPSIPNRVRSVSVGDFNNDSLRDLLYGSSNGASTPGIHIALGGPGGTFTGSQLVLAGEFFGPIAGDFDGDGNLDIAGADTGREELTVLSGRGNSSFDPPVVFPLGPNGRNTIAMAAADLDGDGDLDLVRISDSRNVAGVILGDGAGAFGAETEYPLGTTPFDLAIADFDGDGIPDIAVPHRGSDDVRILRGTGGGLFAPAQAIPNLRGDAQSARAADLDGDGVQDLVVAMGDDDRIALLGGLGGGLFADPVFHDVGVDFAAAQQPLALALGDFDGDGTIDAAAANFSDDTATVFFATGEPEGYRSPAGDFSRLVRLPDGSHRRDFPDGSSTTFDADGLQTATSDPDGNASTYSYDAGGRLVRVVDPVGRITMLTYSGANLASIADPAGRATSFEHDAEGNLTAIVDPDGSRREFAYDAFHSLTMQIDKRGGTTRYLYDEFGRNVRVVRPDGTINEISPSETVGVVRRGDLVGTRENPAPAVDMEAVVATFSDGNGHVTEYRTNRFGAASEEVDPLGRVTTSTYDADGLLTRIVLPRGNAYQYSYDSRGRRVRVVEPSGTEVRFQYDGPFDGPTAIRDQATRVTTFAYDERGNIVSRTDPNGNVRMWEYDARGLTTRYLDENESATTYEYDAFGNLTRVVDALGNDTRVQLDAVGRQTSVVEGFGTPEQRTATFAFDAMNRLVSAADGTGVGLVYEYDLAGNETRVVLPSGAAVRTYDAMNRVVANTDPRFGATTYAYDGEGNIVSTTDALGRTTALEYDAADNLVSRTEPGGFVSDFEYDANDNLLRIADPQGRATVYEYDTSDRRTAIVDSAGQRTTFNYDQRHAPTRESFPGGQSVSYSYDFAGRMTRVGVSGASGSNNTIDVQYDPAGNATRVDDLDSRTEYMYDALNRRISAATVAKFGSTEPPTTLTYAYDAVGNLRTLTYARTGMAPLGTIAYLYDAGGRTTQIDSSEMGIFDLDYDATGRNVRIDYPNGTSRTTAYDGARLMSLGHVPSDGPAILSAALAYDAVGNATSIQEGAVRRVFAYDPRDQLLSGGADGTAEAYTYTAAGNRATSHLSAAHVHGTLHELLQDDDFAYAYDVRGRLDSRTDRATSDVVDYVFSNDSRLRSVVLPDATAISYRYDGSGRRIEKVVGGVATRYVHDRDDILLEFDGDGQVAALYVHGPGADQPLGMRRGGMNFFFHADHRASIRAVTDATGAVVNSYDYDAFGNFETRVEAVANPYGFAGREYDPETGLYNYRARYYDPVAGRFISPDPIRFESGDLNLFRYVGNNPVNFIDPTGQEILTLIGIGIVAIVVTKVATDKINQVSRLNLAQVEREAALFGLDNSTVDVSPAEECFRRADDLARGNRRTIRQAAAAFEAGATYPGAGLSGGTPISSVPDAVGAGLLDRIFAFFGGD